jgi:hypothetical protein
MELTSNDDGKLTTISENGNEKRKLNRGTIVISFVWCEETKICNHRVGYLYDGDTYRCVIFTQHSPNTFSSPLRNFIGPQPSTLAWLLQAFELDTLSPESILLSTTSGSTLYPEQIILDDKLISMIQMLIDGEVSKHEQHVLGDPPVFNGARPACA